MNVVPLASSSKGNAYLVEHDGTVVLIDCGLSYRELGRRCKEKLGTVGGGVVSGFSCDQIAAVLVTHDHGDHTAGLTTFLKHHDVPVYANMMTAEAVFSDCAIAEDSFVCFENGQEFRIGSLEVLPFSVPHDTSDPVGYLVSGGPTTYFHGTDIGTPLDSIGMKLAAADIATLESNHDPVMLRNSGRAPSLIQRIAGPRGHLSNDQAAELVRRFATPKLKKLMLAHLSQDCNSPHLAERAVREALATAGFSEVELSVLAP